jgi:hypothetical protein
MSPALIASMMVASETCHPAAAVPGVALEPLAEALAGALLLLAGIVKSAARSAPCTASMRTASEICVPLAAVLRVVPRVVLELLAEANAEALLLLAGMMGSAARISASMSSKSSSV